MVVFNIGYIVLYVDLLICSSITFQVPLNLPVLLLCEQKFLTFLQSRSCH